MTTVPKNYDKPNAPEQGGEEGKPAPAQHPEDRGPKVRPTPADPGGPVPRVVKPQERAPQGFARFKVSCRNYQEAGAHPTLYILTKADDEKTKGKPEKPDEASPAEESARTCYLKAVGLDQTLARIAKNRASATKAAGRKVEDLEPLDPPDLVIVPLPD